MARPGKRLPKYESPVPRAPSCVSAYELFTREVYAQIAAEFPLMSRAEKVSAAGELWRKLSVDEQSNYEQEAERQYREAKEIFDRDEPKREESRKDICNKLGIPMTSTWQEVDEHNLTKWAKEHNVDVELVKKKRLIRDDNEKSRRAKTTENGNADQHDIQTIASTKGRRAASAAATQKMQEQVGTSVNKDFLATADSSEPMEVIASNGDGDELGDKSEVKPKADEKPRKRPKTTSIGHSNNLPSVNISAMLASSSSNTNMMASSKWSPSNMSVVSASDTASSGLKISKSRLGDMEWQNALWGEERVQAVSKAIDRVYDMSMSEQNFQMFGNDMIQCFYDVATVTGEPIRSKTLKYVEHLANRWKHTVMQEGWKEGDMPLPSEVMEVVTGMYCMERVGIRHDLKAEVAAFLESNAAFGVAEYFGWNPIGNEGLPPDGQGGRETISDTEVSRYRLFSSSLIHAFYADRVGLTLGCPYVEIFKWLPTLRPYKGPSDLSWEEYVDQCYLVTHVIFTTNNWGELRLSPSHFPHEYFFLRSHLPVHIYLRDVHLIAEFVESLRCFGCSDDDPLIRQGMRVLLDKQTSQGLWDDTGNLEPYRTYHATMCSAQALLAHKFRGYGPGIPSTLPLLTKWTSTDRDSNGELCPAELLEKSLQCISQKHQQVKNQRDHEFKDVPLCTVIGDYAPYFGNEIVTASESVSLKNNIYRPAHMSTHVEERMLTLKHAIRGFAKKKDIAEIATGDSPSCDPVDSSPSKSTATQSNLTESNLGLTVEELSTLNRLNDLVGLYLSSGSCAKDSESKLLLNTLQEAEDIPVTATVFQSTQYGNLARQIRQLSKAPRTTEESSDGAIADLCSKAAAVVTKWKNSVLATQQQTK